MPVDLPTLAAALLSGLTGSVHCVAMCGGIATGLAASTGASGPALGRAAEFNIGRVMGYVLAGALVGALGGGLLRVADTRSVQVGLRVALGIAMMLIALRLAGAGDRWNLLARLGAPAWRALQPLRRRLVPANTTPRRLALGMLWGWLPCGLSSSLLVVAWLQADAANGALVMAAFGAGTLPAMLPLTWSGARAPLRGGRRRAAAVFVFLAGLLTATAPWLMQVPALHDVLAALGCRAA
jgi:sulfite exporter TauE/SafE